ncbi:MAG: hypothetical protein ABGY41_09330 [Candidatus Poribacteria bacterium]
MAFELHEGTKVGDGEDTHRWRYFFRIGTYPTAQEAQLESFHIWDRSSDDGMPAGRKTIWDDKTANSAFPPAAADRRFIIRIAP